jgi:CRISPR-associated protein Csy2
MMSDAEAVLLLPHLRVQNVNAVSGPLTWGFPAPTAFAGFVHALERHMGDAFRGKFGGVGVVCHRFEPLVHKPVGRRNQVLSLTRNPLYAGWKPFVNKPGAIVEEGRAHMEVSLLIEILIDLDDEERADLTEMLPVAIQSMRLAGGSILPDPGEHHPPAFIDWYDADDDNAAAFRKLRHRLLPGFALVQRADLLAQHLAAMREDDGSSEATALDALLDLSRLNFEPAGPDPDQPVETLWEIRRRPGWLVPVPVGYAALSELYAPGQVSNTRDEHTPFRFVESLYSLGQWVSPHRLTELNQLVWRSEYSPDDGLYCCVNHFADTLDPAQTGQNREYA